MVTERRDRTLDGVRDLRDFVTFSARAGGHLNADGLCFLRPTAAISY